MAADVKKRTRTEKALDAYKESFASTSGRVNKDKFNVKVIQYPSDLQTAPNLQHYVLFNINVRGKSKFNEDNRQFEVKRNLNSANLSPDEMASPVIRGVTYATAGVAAGVAVTSLVSKAADAFGLSGAGKTGPAAASRQSSVNVGSKVAGTVVGATVGATMAASNLLKKDTTYRISDAIALYVDGPPSVKYSMNYANKELGTLLGVLSGSVFDGQGLKSAGGEIGAALGASLAKLPGAFGAADVGSALSVSSGTSLNPFRETVFESVDFRSFAFKYKFFPKNKKESDDVYNIINTFKFHMHPEMSEGKLFFIYPSEFNISYYFGSEENGYFHKFATCVLENMEVNYGGEQFSSFRDGAPTEVNMSLTFRELEILTKNMVREGY